MFPYHVRDGLSRPDQKQLSCEYFYDEVGSALFEVITLLPEYGLTRADARLVRRLSPEITNYLRPAAVVELGSGTGSKTRYVLQELTRQATLTYSPIDLSASALDRCARELAPFAQVNPIESAYLNGLRQALCRRPAAEAVLVLFLGSTIGNFERSAARDFLGDIRACLRPGDALLVGADLVQSIPRMVRAYDDPAGVTAAFNRNLLARINRELGGDFVLKRFAHEARWNPEHRRVEMHLRSLATQTAFIRAAGIECEFREDETIWTESCHKFHSGEIAEMAAAAGFTCAAEWRDEEWPFSETLLLA